MFACIHGASEHATMSEGRSCVGMTGKAMVANATM